MSFEAISGDVNPKKGQISPEKAKELLLSRRILQAAVHNFITSNVVVEENKLPHALSVCLQRSRLEEDGTEIVGYYVLVAPVVDDSIQPADIYKSLTYIGSDRFVTGLEWWPIPQPNQEGGFDQFDVEEMAHVWAGSARDVNLLEVGQLELPSFEFDQSKSI